MCFKDARIKIDNKMKYNPMIFRNYFILKVSGSLKADGGSAYLLEV